MSIHIVCFHGHGSFACRPLYWVVHVLSSDTKRVDSNMPRVVPTAWVEGSKKTRLYSFGGTQDVPELFFCLF